MKVNNAGVMPIIFAMTIVSFPGIIINMFFSGTTFGQAYLRTMANGTWLYGIIMALFIIFFTYFYSTISFNPVEISRNIRRTAVSFPASARGSPPATIWRRSAPASRCSRRSFSPRWPPFR
jgi:preprotein translocase subunit SecY